MSTATIAVQTVQLLPQTSEVQKERVLGIAPGYPERATFKPSETCWSVKAAGYSPPFFESKHVLENDRTKKPNGWADPSDLTKENFFALQKEGKLKSVEKQVELDSETGRPLNPRGRTGIAGRGSWGKWGANNASDFLVVRMNPKTSQLEGLFIKRKTGEWAIPGGMRDGLESGYEAAIRELKEEASIDTNQFPPLEIYEGYVADPRNTDNAWVETALFMTYTGSAGMELNPFAGDDAREAEWLPFTETLINSLYASHGALVRMAIDRLRLELSNEEKKKCEPQLTTIQHEPLLTTFQGLKGKVGIFGGTFDPLHKTHCALVEAAAKWHQLDTIVFVPTPQNPLKVDGPVASHFQRLSMIREAIVDHPNWFVSPVQERNRNLLYSAHLIKEVKKQAEPNTDVHLIIGGDCIADFSRWKAVEEISKNAKIVTLSRKGSDLDSAMKTLPPDIRKNIEQNLVPGILPAQSATQIRNAVSLEENFDSGLPSVSKYISEFGLYKSNSRLQKEFHEMSEHLRNFGKLYRALTYTTPESTARDLLTLPDAERKSAIELLKQVTTISPLLLSHRKPQIVELEAKVTPSKRTKLTLDQAILLVKESKIEYDMRKRGVTYDELIKQYEGESVDIPDIIQSHDAHKNSVKLLEASLPEMRVEILGKLPHKQAISLAQKAKLVIAAGGDDTIKAASRFVKDQFFLGINTDIKFSHGALCSFSAEQFLHSLPAILAGDFTVEEWTRLTVDALIAKDGKLIQKTLPPTLSEIVIAGENFFFTMRGTLHYQDLDRKIKGSGIMIATGAGSTGWLPSARKHVFPLGKPWLKTKPYAEFGNIMSFLGGGDQIETGELLPGEVVTFTSSGNRKPMICGDSVWFQRFPRGSKATVRISDLPLKVIVPN